MQIDRTDSDLSDDEIREQLERDRLKAEQDKLDELAYRKKIYRGNAPRPTHDPKAVEKMGFPKRNG